MCINSGNFIKILVICVEMKKPEIQSMIFASCQSITQRHSVHAFYNFYTFIKVEYQHN